MGVKFSGAGAGFHRIMGHKIVEKIVLARAADFILRIFLRIHTMAEVEMGAGRKLFEVVYEDAELLVVNKPADLVCHPTKGDVYSSLISRVRLHVGGGNPQLVNRLDRETSGLVFVADRKSVV